MAVSRDAAFLDEIAELLETLDGAEETVDVAENLPTMDTHYEPVEQTSTNSKSNGRRSRQRDELEYLRQHVSELESELIRLQPSAVRSVSPADDVWQRAALRQMNAKQKAEAENAKLREMLQGQLKVARGLEKLLRKQSNHEEIDGADAATSKRLKTVSTFSDSAIFQQLQQHIDRRHSDFESIFFANGLAAASWDYEDVRVLEGDASAPIVLEILHAQVLPFDFISTSAAVWKCSSMSSLQLPGGQYAPVQSGDDHATAKFEAPMQLRRQYATVHVHLALKRYRDHAHQREVFAWSSFSKTVSSYKPLDGIEASDHGWTVVEAFPTSELDSGRSIVRCCSRFAPDEQMLPRYQPIGTFSDFVLAHYNRNYATLFEIVENALFDDKRVGASDKHGG